MRETSDIGDWIEHYARIEFLQENVGRVAWAWLSEDEKQVYRDRVNDYLFACVEDDVTEPEALAERLSEDELRLAVAAFGEFVLAYRRTYMETQTHPTAGDEAKVMAKARALCDDFGLKAREGDD